MDNLWKLQGIEDDLVHYQELKGFLTIIVKMEIILDSIGFSSKIFSKVSITLCSEIITGFPIVNHRIRIYTPITTIITNNILNILKNLKSILKRSFIERILLFVAKNTIFTLYLKIKTKIY